MNVLLSEKVIHADCFEDNDIGFLTEGKVTTDPPRNAE